MDKYFNKTFVKNIQTTDQNGDVNNITRSYTVQVKSTEFYMIFPDLNEIIDKINITCLKIVVELLRRTEFDKNKCTINPEIRTEIIKHLDIHYNTFITSIRRLKEAGIIKTTRYSITINPKYFWKGSIKEREKFIKEMIYANTNR